MTKDKKAAKDQLLLEAARLGDLRQLESILGQLQQLRNKKKSNPLASLRKITGPNNIRDPVTGFTCLHHAALNGHWQCVELILEHDAKVNAVDYKGSSALHLASWAGNLEVVKILLSHRQQHNGREWCSSAQHDQQMAEQRHQQSPTGSRCNRPRSPQALDIDLCNNDNQTALSLAAQFGHELVVGELLANGADVTIRNSLLESPLDLACLNGRLATVDLLLRRSPSLVADLRRPRSVLLMTAARLHSGAPRLDRPLSTSLDYTRSPIVQPDSPTSGTSVSSQSAHQRRSSGSGWSALLRGRRDSAASQSPLQRLTATTLSMRQRSPKLPATSSANHQDQLVAAGGNKSPSIGRQTEEQLGDAGNFAPPGRVANERRRATLTVGAQAFSFNSEQVDWQTGNGDLGAISDQHEQLLDHSPLHYATRRGHVEVVNLLLVVYQANLLQVSSLGSVLHEIASNNGKHSDMISLFFNFISSQTNESYRTQMLDRFLNLKNVQQKSVFELLNDINNRSAQEIKRLIYEFSEHLQVRPLGQEASNQIKASQIQDAQGVRYAGSQFSSSQQRQQQQQFSDLQQINSFVTMKRVPKSQRMHHQRTLDEPATGRLDYGQVMAASSGSNAHSIDRRAVSSMSQRAAQSEVFFDSNLRQFAPPQNQEELHFSHKQQEAAAMTRSVSNLSQTATYGDRCNHEEPLIATNGLTWSQWLSSRGANSAASPGNANQPDYRDPIAQQQMVQQFGTAEQTARQRSKSRDLGMLLVEAQNQLNRKGQTEREHLYDNSDSRQSPFENAPTPSSDLTCAERLACWPNQAGLKSSNSSANHLVRSQTDCSHLMGRFFGDHQTGAPSYLKQSANAQARCLANQQANYLHNATLDRKTINRHYHVYEHEFYPPRLLAGNQHQLGAHSSSGASIADERQGKPLLAVVPPLGRNQPDSASRASVRSTSSYQQQQQQALHLNTRPNGSLIAPASYATSNSSSGQENRLPSDSRLSLNIDQQKFGVSDHMNAMPNHQMDRFLSRHSRKSTGAPNLVDVAMRNDRSASVEQQTRRDLVELQRKLAVSQESGQSQERIGQQLHNSYSLESHLSEPHLFDSARRTLLQDFNQMIGEELLNRDGKSRRSLVAADNNELAMSQRQIAPISQSTMLTGVMLDMDRHGERITVSGLPVSANHSSDGSRKSSERSHRLSLNRHELIKLGHEERLSNGTLSTTTSSSSADGKLLLDSLIGGSNQASRYSSRQGCNREIAMRNHDGDEDEKFDCSGEPAPPPKPPRLSLLKKCASQVNGEPDELASASLGRQKLVTSQRVSGELQRAVIYDLPATREERIQKNSRSLEQTNHQVSRTSSGVGSRVQTIGPGQVMANGAFRAALTRPPSVRPPPPPLSSAKAAGSSSPSADSSIENAFATPLRVVAANDSELTGSSCCSNSSTSSSTGNDVGLLKMASMTSSSSGSSVAARHQLRSIDNDTCCQKRLATVASRRADPDSGVCTSNSPASLSHDSEEPSSSINITAALKRTRPNESAVVRHSTGRGASFNPNQQPTSVGSQLHLDTLPVGQLSSGASAIVSPPSPNTAQLCIEEALMPLEKQSTDRTTSPRQSRAGLHQIEAVDRWLKNEADYENCQTLQLHVQPVGEGGSNLLSIRNLLAGGSRDTATKGSEPSFISSSIEKASRHGREKGDNQAEDDEEDYAGSASESNSSQISSSNVDADTSPRELNLDKSPLKGDENGSAQRKEVLVKVVTEQSADGQIEVFYIDPLELKKITTTEQRSQTMDAGSLTDEELCAAVDKSSGYIRFTLRKRRNKDCEAEEENRQVVKLKNRDEMSALLERLELESEQQTRKQRTNSIHQFSIKKTRLNSSQEEEVTKDPSKVSMKRHSFVGDLLSEHCKRLDQEQIVAEIATKTAKEKTIDTNNNHKQAATNKLQNFDARNQVSQVKQWFASRLAGLVEYADKFTENGFDDVQYYNHPKLINDETLKSLGIDNESHRLLIIDRIGSELKPLEFESILRLNLPNEKGILTSDELLEALNLGRFMRLDDCLAYSTIQLRDEDSIRSMQDNQLFEKLLPGHRARLSAALDHLLERCSGQNATRQESELRFPPKSTPKQASIDSNSTGEVEMDASQASATSSSSKESIKSIVSLKQQKPNPDDQSKVVPVQQSNPNATAELGDSCSDNPAQSKDRDMEKVEGQHQATAAREVIKGSRAIYSGFNRPSQQTGSLVSEVARRLEAASKCQNNNYQRPIAASRRINGCNLVNASSEEQTTRALPGDKENLSGKALRQPNAFIPVKSICWPPQSNKNTQQPASNGESPERAKQTPSIKPIACLDTTIETENRVTAANLEPKAVNNQQQVAEIIAQTSKPLRPKPAPPAKPSKLVAGKLNADMSYKL